MDDFSLSDGYGSPAGPPVRMSGGRPVPVNAPTGTPINFANVQAPQPGMPVGAQPIAGGAWTDPRGMNPQGIQPQIANPTIPPIVQAPWGAPNAPDGFHEFQGMGGYRYRVFTNGRIEIARPGSDFPGVVITSASHPAAYAAILAEFTAQADGRQIDPRILQAAISGAAAAVRAARADGGAPAFDPGPAPGAAPATTTSTRTVPWKWILGGGAALLALGGGWFMWQRR